MFDHSQIINLALAEDMPEGDITTDSLKSHEKNGRARLLAKSTLVLSGSEVFEQTFKTVDPKTSVHWHAQDGDFIKKGFVVAHIDGKLTSLLKAERTALNFLGHLSGIATLTATFMKTIKGTKTRITDTRKTTPGLRLLEKQAVTHGGGTNHRMSLSDQILIKENHIRTAGSITNAVALARIGFPQKKIEVEVESLEELQEALLCHVDRVMLDNMQLNEMKKAVKFVKGRCEVEASGNMSLKTIAKVAATGVDFISVGKITHSAPCADLSLLFEE